MLGLILFLGQSLLYGNTLVTSCLLSCVWLSTTLQCPLGLLCPWDFPGKNTEAGCCASSRVSSWPTDWTQVSWVSCIGRWVLYHCAVVGLQEVAFHESFAQGFLFSSHFVIMLFVPYWNILVHSGLILLQYIDWSIWKESWPHTYVAGWERGAF